MNREAIGAVGEVVGAIGASGRAQRIGCPLTEEVQLSSKRNQEFVREIIEANRYLTLATTDGSRPWSATLEYLNDEQLGFYFFSTDDSLHARHIERNPEVAFSVFSPEQPEYSADSSAALSGVQVSATAARLSPDEYPQLVLEAIEALSLPMPPYSVFRLAPSAFYLPRIEGGVNVRVAVDGLPA